MKLLIQTDDGELLTVAPEITHLDPKQSVHDLVAPVLEKYYNEHPFIVTIGDANDNIGRN